MLPFDRIIAVMLILVLIVAVVLISVSRQGITQVQSFSEAQSLCGTVGQSSCDSAGDLPFSWVANKLNTEEGEKPCAEIMECDTCGSCGFS